MSSFKRCLLAATCALGRVKLAGSGNGSWPCRLGQPLDATQDREADRWKQASFNFYDKRLLGGAWVSQQDPELIKQFCRILAVCHTAIPDGEEQPRAFSQLASWP